MTTARLVAVQRCPVEPNAPCSLLRAEITAPRANRGLELTFGDTAAYWIPKVSWTDSRGTTALKASQTFFYYRAGLKDPADVQPYPAGLKIVTVQGQNVQWRCLNGAWSTTPPTQCSNGKLVLRIKFPDCLQVDANGPMLDTPPPACIPVRPPLAHGRCRVCGVPGHPPNPRTAAPNELPVPHPNHSWDGEALLTWGPLRVYHARRLLQRLAGGDARGSGGALHQRGSVLGYESEAQRLPIGNEQVEERRRALAALG